MGEGVERREGSQGEMAIRKVGIGENRGLDGTVIEKRRNEERKILRREERETRWD